MFASYFLCHLKKSESNYIQDSLLYILNVTMVLEQVLTVSSAFSKAPDLQTILKLLITYNISLKHQLRGNFFCQILGMLLFQVCKFFLWLRNAAEMLVCEGFNSYKILFLCG